jgi:thiol-disulfide isomerase/thioredoxin
MPKPRLFSIVAPIVVALTACLTRIAVADEASVTTVAVGDKAPALHVRSLDGKTAISTADYAGKTLVLNFWATWCPPCRAETPDMIRSYAHLKGSDVAFLAIDTTEVPSVIKTFVSAKGVTYPIAVGGADAYNGLGIAFIPTTLVIDPKGIVRARWTGELPTTLLTQFVADARAEKSFVIDTPDERIVERLLDPAGIDFNAPDALKSVKEKVQIAEAFADVHSSGPNATVDDARVFMLEGRLGLPAAQAALAAAKTPQERTAATRALVAAYGRLNRFADAIVALKAAQKDDPADQTLSLDIARADYRLHDYADGIANAKAYTVAKPDDADGWDELALEYQRDRDFADAAPAYERDVALLIAAASAAKPADRVDAIANVADTALDLADVYVALGDQAGTARAFTIANTYGDKLDPKGPYANLYRNVHERTQEGLVAARMMHGGNKTAISIAPWTGPDLPGSLSSTFKYRLIVAKAPSSKIDLRALGLPKGWIASFCADGLCSPMHVSAELPESGVKTYEFQLVPRGSMRNPGSVRIASADGVTATI